jgi:hypothetical protein
MPWRKFWPALCCICQLWTESDSTYFGLITTHCVTNIGQNTSVCDPRDTIEWAEQYVLKLRVVLSSAIDCSRIVGWFMLIQIHCLTGVLSLSISDWNRTLCRILPHPSHPLLFTPSHLQGCTKAGRLNILWWQLIFMGSGCGACFMSHVWRLEFYSFGKFVHPWSSYMLRDSRSLKIIIKYIYRLVSWSYYCVLMFFRF